MSQNTVVVVVIGAAVAAAAYMMWRSSHTRAHAQALKHVTSHPKHASSDNVSHTKTQPAKHDSSKIREQPPKPSYLHGPPQPKMKVPASFDGSKRIRYTLPDFCFNFEAIEADSVLHHVKWKWFASPKTYPISVESSASHASEPVVHKPVKHNLPPAPHRPVGRASSAAAAAFANRYGFLPPMQAMGFTRAGSVSSSDAYGLAEYTGDVADQGNVAMDLLTKGGKVKLGPPSDPWVLYNIKGQTILCTEEEASKMYMTVALPGAGFSKLFDPTLNGQQKWQVLISHPNTADAMQHNGTSGPMPLWLVRVSLYNWHAFLKHFTMKLQLVDGCCELPYKPYSFTTPGQEDNVGRLTYRLLFHSQNKAGQPAYVAHTRLQVQTDKAAFCAGTPVLCL